MRFVLLMLTVFFVSLYSSAQITLEQCIEKAKQNYPLIKKYALLEATSDVNLSDINKSWLPNIGVYAQGTIQNSVPSFPDALSDVLAQMGQELKGMGKFQYKAAIELNQTIWDGGESKARRRENDARTRRQNAALDVEMYTIAERIENLYFGCLLYAEQISQIQSTLQLLTANAEEMQKLLEGGMAMQSDVDMVQAQILSMRQQLTRAEASHSAMLEMLGIFTGESTDSKDLVKPSAEMPTTYENNRPELNLFERRIHENTIMKESVRTSLLPKAALFGSAYYGYPGLDYFESMRNRDMNFNVIGGIKLTWSVTPFYTKKNRYSRLDISSADIENDRETFLFNSRLQSSSQLKEIESLRKVIADDEKIAELRSNVRKAAESQLRNGIIDATNLLTKITDENNALLAKKYNEILLLQNIYKLKYILNQ